jgi:hypothetical protein
MTEINKRRYADSPNLKTDEKKSFLRKKLKLSWCVVMKKRKEEAYNLCSSNCLYWKIEKNLWVVMKSIPTTKKIRIAFLRRKSYESRLQGYSRLVAKSRGRESRFIWAKQAENCENHVWRLQNRVWASQKPNQTDAEYLSNNQL